MNAPLRRVPSWGAPYGDAPKYDSDGEPYWLHRKGQKCRWYDATGAQEGPEQANVAPALAYAHSLGWVS